MDIFLMLDREVLRASPLGVPRSWMRDPRLAGHASAAAMCSINRRHGADQFRNSIEIANRRSGGQFGVQSIARIFLAGRRVLYRCRSSARFVDPVEAR